MSYTIKEELENKRRSIESYHDAIKEATLQMAWLSEAKELIMSEVYLALESLSQDMEKPIDGFIFKFANEDYQYILGGDGRSAPWDEKRNGLVCHISGVFFFTKEQGTIIRDYLKSVLKVEQVVFENQHQL